MVIDMPKGSARGGRTSPDLGAVRASAFLTFKVTAAQRAAVEMLARSREESISATARSLIDESLRRFVDEDGLNLLDAVELDQAHESAQAQRIAHRFGQREP